MAEGSAGYDISASASAANKSGGGATTFGSISFGNVSSGLSPLAVLAIVGAVVFALFFFWKKK